MNKEKKIGMVPRLRFAEFEGEWEEENFSRFIKLYRGSSPRPIQEYLTQDESGVNWIKIGDTKFSENSVINKVEEKITPEGAEKSRKVEVGELILANSMSFGKTYQLAIEGCIYDGWFVLREYEKHFYKPFLLQLLNSEYMQEQYQRLSAGGIVQNISSEIVYNTVLFHTSIEEQQKIATCLTSLDDLISAQVERQKALQRHKKGLMQQLFPAEGERVPRVRFGEFEDAGDWEPCPLKKVFSIFQGFAFSSTDSVQKGARWLKIADVSIQQMNHNAPSFLPEKSKVKYQSFMVKEGDYVMALTRPILNKELKIAQIDTIFHDALLNQRVGKIISAQNITFVYYLLQTSKLISDIEKSIAGSEPPNLSAQQIENIETFIPSKLEQQKIASCLTTLDAHIAAEVQKLAALKEQKKGLMQGMFPNLKTERL